MAYAASRLTSLTFLTLGILKASFRLLSQLDTPVVLKDGTMMTKPDGSPMTKQEAIATNILNLAMKGDVKAAQYIQNIQMRAKIMKKK